MDSLKKSEMSSGSFLEIIDKLPHSKTRVPYTYHHDYLRQHSKAHKQMSRSEVASSHTADNIELYAIALVQILDELGSLAFSHISSKDVYVCKKAIEIAESSISRYDSELSNSI